MNLAEREMELGRSRIGVGEMLPGSLNVGTRLLLSLTRHYFFTLALLLFSRDWLCVFLEKSIVS